jgi:ammonia channel protein AmtB
MALRKKSTAQSWPMISFHFVIVFILWWIAGFVKKEKGAGLMIMGMVEFVQQKKSPGKITTELSAGKIFVRWNGKERSAHTIHQIIFNLESIK